VFVDCKPAGHEPAPGKHVASHLEALGEVVEKCPDEIPVRACLPALANVG
jgi:hypothetical protein